MRIGLVGYGKMGREVERLALESGHEVAWRLDAADNEQAEGLGPERLALVDLCIEFTTPSAAAGNVRRILAEGAKVVCGTTGWFDALPRIRDAARPEAGLVWGSNFSVGAYLFKIVAQEAARRFGRFPEYDAAIHEIHHAAKADHPSGTARSLAAVLLESSPSKTGITADLGDGAIARGRLHVSSTRVGHVPGMHTVYFDGPFDTIEVRHTARSRGGFARGALLAAEWLWTRSGIYSFEDVVASRMEEA